MGVDDVEELSVEDVRKKLEDEGDFAADYLEDLLDIAELDGDIEMSVEADRAAVAIVMDEGTDRRLKRLIGRHGETLDALQELTRLAVQNKTSERSRLMLDILGYREGRRQTIQAIAREAVEQVKETGEAYSLKPMNPFERKVVHDVVAEAGLYSDSSGVGPNRHVVVMMPLDDADDLSADHDDDEATFDSPSAEEITPDELSAEEISAASGESANDSDELSEDDE